MIGVKERKEVLVTVSDSTKYSYHYLRECGDPQSARPFTYNYSSNNAITNCFYTFIPPRIKHLLSSVYVLGFSRKTSHLTSSLLNIV